MPVQKLYRVQCGDCMRFLPKSSVPPTVPALTDPGATPLFTSYQDAVEAAQERGWPGPPAVCPACAGRKP